MFVKFSNRDGQPINRRLKKAKQKKKKFLQRKEEPLIIVDNYQQQQQQKQLQIPVNQRIKQKRKKFCLKKQDEQLLDNSPDLDNPKCQKQECKSLKLLLRHQLRVRSDKMAAAIRKLFRTCDKKDSGTKNSENQLLNAKKS